MVLTTSLKISNDRNFGTRDVTANLKQYPFKNQTLNYETYATFDLTWQANKARIEMNQSKI
jgi:hypothetical protein